MFNTPKRARERERECGKNLKLNGCFCIHSLKQAQTQLGNIFCFRLLIQPIDGANKKKTDGDTATESAKSMEMTQRNR